MLVLVAWAVAGPLCNFSDTWRLVINAGTTIVTFLMVFLIQNTQNPDSEALQLKLDELIRAVEAGGDALLDLEELDDDALAKIRERHVALAKANRQGREGRPPGRPPRLRDQRGVVLRARS